jgi:hypothetical protein
MRKWGLRYSNALRRARKAEFLGDGEKVAQVPELHYSNVWIGPNLDI